MDNEPSKDRDNEQRLRASMVGLGLNMTSGMIFFSVIGYYLDQKTGGGQVWTLGGIFMGLFYCGYEVWKIVRQNDRDLKK